MLLSPSGGLRPPPPFLVLALPRSRTRWLAEFLSWGPWRCTHEEARHLRSMEDVKSWLSQPFVGSVETAVAPFWRLIPKNVRIVVVRRAVPEVAKSLSRVMSQPRSLGCFLKRLDAKLDQIQARSPGVVAVTYDDLATPEGARKVFEHALQIPFDTEWWDLLRGVNIQEPFTTFERYAVAYLPQLTRMAGLAKGAILRDMALRAPRSVEGIEFAEEPFEVFLRDGAPLFAEAAFATGGVSDWFRQMNLPLLQAISDAGAMQIVTARSNGRMFGYLMCEIAPSRESPSRFEAVETATCASSDIPGLGMKLQRETLRRLRARGVSNVWFRAGTRGGGPRMPAVYKRVGAVSAGSLWRLDLSDEGIS